MWGIGESLHHYPKQRIKQLDQALLLLQEWYLQRIVIKKKSNQIKYYLNHNSNRTTRKIQQTHATKSGLIRKSFVGPIEENEAKVLIVRNSGFRFSKDSLKSFVQQPLPKYQQEYYF